MTRRTARVVAVLAVAAPLLAGCGPASHTLADLVAHQESYDGKVVSTTGTVRGFHDATGTYYVIEDADADRVLVKPASLFANRVGQAVTVTGRFNVTTTEGRVLTVTAVASAGP